MSNIDFFNPSDVPQPRDKIRIESLEATPYPDGWRVKIVINVTPFQDRPSLEIQVRTAEGRVVSELSVIETMIRHMEFTVHLRGLQSPVGDYVASAGLYFGQDRTQMQHTTEISFQVKAPQ